MAIYRQIILDPTDYAGYTGSFNNKIVQESFKIEQSLGDYDELRCCCANPSKLTLEVAPNFALSPLFDDVVGHKVYLKIRGINDNEEELFKIHMGKYTFVSDEKTEGKVTRTLTAYDDIYKIVNTDITEWYHYYIADKKQVSITEFILDMLDYIGIEGESVPICTEMFYPFYIGIEEETVSAKYILDRFCEYTGTVATMNYEKLKFSKIGSLMTGGDLSVVSKKTYGYITNAPRYVTVKSSAELTGVTVDMDAEEITGADGNYVITANPFFAPLQEPLIRHQVANRFSEITGNIYTPCECTAIIDGNFYANNGGIGCRVGIGETEDTIIMNSEITGIHNMQIKFNCFGKAKYETDTNYQYYDLESVKNKVTDLSQLIYGDNTNASQTVVKVGNVVGTNKVEIGSEETTEIEAKAPIVRGGVSLLPAQIGRFNVTCNAGTYTTYTLEFPKEFATNNYEITFGFYGTPNANTGKIIPTSYSRTKGSAVLRIYNTHTSSISANITWIAIANE